MKTGIALLCVFGLGLIFDYWKVGPVPVYHDFFLFSNQQLTAQYYLWSVLEKVGFLLVLFLWYKEAGEYSKVFVLAFMVLMVGEFVDYLLSYSELKYLGLTYNKWFVILYGTFLIIKAWKDK